MTQLGSLTRRLAGPLIASPLAPFVDAYRGHLTACGYAEGTQLQYLGGVAHFGRWMTSERIALHEVGPGLVTRFLAEHLPGCRCSGRVQRHRPQVRAGLHQLLAVLHEAGLTSAFAHADMVELELDRFDAYLRDGRGLASNTRRQRRGIVGKLLRCSLDEDCRLRPIDAVMVQKFMAERLERWSPASGAVLAGALRAYLRYRAVCGDEVRALLPVIVSPACWKLAPLPATLTNDEVERVLGSFHALLPSRLRGAAVAQCVARLGLRSSEVVGLELDDIDWDVGAVTLRRCKSRRMDVLPLPVAVGAAIVEYLRDERPVCITRRVFVRHVAPVEVPLQPSLVGRVIRGAYRRCGLRHTRVHIFRNSLAARVLDGGGTLKEVADVLRHRSLDTAQIYAKLDERRLAGVAMPWPGSMS